MKKAVLTPSVERELTSPIERAVIFHLSQIDVELATAVAAHGARGGSGESYRINLGMDGACKSSEIVVSSWPCEQEIAHAMEMLSGWTIPKFLKEWAPPCTVNQWRD